MKGQMAWRLEEALRCWEDRCAIVTARKAMYKAARVRDPLPDSPFIHAPDFRRSLLASSNNGKPSGWIDERFIPPNPTTDADGHEKAAQQLTCLSRIPYLLSVWTRSSRRVFHITEELTQLLTATSLRGLCWDDVGWPFSAFAIALDKPLIDRGISYDCILASRIPLNTQDKDTSPVFIMLFSELMGVYAHCHRQARETMERLVRQQKWQKANDAYRRWACWWGDCCHKHNSEGVESVGLPYEAIAERNVTDHAFDMRTEAGLPTRTGEDEPWGLYDSAIRLVVNLCTYLETLPPQIRLPFRRIPVQPHDGRRGCITDSAMVCAVTAEHFLTAEERRLVLTDRDKKGGYTLPIHWRRAHTRREKGCGDDPTAPRTVKVRATLVNRHMLRPGELPGGTVAVLK